MASTSSQKSSILATNQQFNEALAARNSSALKATFADNILLHGDGLSLGDDIQGADKVLNHVENTLFDKYDFTHTTIASATVGKDSCAFSFWQRKGMKEKGSSHDPQDIVGVYHHLLDNDFRIKETWFLRQLSADEVETKMQKRPSRWQHFTADPMQWGKPATYEHTKERCQQQQKETGTFNEMWHSGDASGAPEMMASDVRIYDPMFGTSTKVVEDFESRVETFSQAWKQESNMARRAYSHGDKGFLWWQATCTKKDIGLQDTLFGVNMLVFNSDSKVIDVVGFRQLTGEETQDLVKEKFQKDT